MTEGAKFSGIFLESAHNEDFTVIEERNNE
jgi:hypothetical protein